MIRRTLVVALVVGALSGCGGGGGAHLPPGSSPTTSTSSTPRAPASLGERLSEALPDVLRAHRLAGQKTPKVRTERSVLGAGTKPKPWHAQGFGAKGLKALEHDVVIKVPGKPRSAVYITLLEAHLPAHASVCEASWGYQVPPTDPCRIEGLTDGRLMTREWRGSYRELVLVRSDWTLVVTAATLNRKNVAVGVPISARAHRQILMSLGNALLAGHGRLAPSDAPRTYVAPGGVRLSLPPSWDARDGVEAGTLNLTDTTGGTRTLFLEQNTSSFDVAKGAPCQVLFERHVPEPGRPSRKLDIRAVAVDERSSLGWVSFEAYVTDKPHGCGTVDGVQGSRGGLVTLRASLRFDSVDHAQAYADGPDFRALVGVMRTLRVG